VPVEAFGELRAISRPGGQGRVHRPASAPAELGPEAVVVKLYRRPPPPGAVDVLMEMVAWSRTLHPRERARLHQFAAWPLAVVSARGAPVGVAMIDVSPRFVTPFAMPSGRRERVLLALEHLLGDDAYLELRGLGVRLGTLMRARVAERVSEALAYLHRYAIVVSDIAPSNLLVSFSSGDPAICFIDCDSMVFRGRQALGTVETGDWNIPAAFAEPPCTRAADAYKLGLVILRLFARCHDARAVAAHLRYVPVELRDMLYRALDRDATNRPPAGEWQRALSQLCADFRLGERYPGPLRAPRPTPVAPSPAERQSAARPLARAVRAVPPAAPTPAASDWLRRGVAVLWILTGTIVLFLILSRLFASTIPVQPSGSSGFSFAPGGQVQYPAYYYSGPRYYVPQQGTGVP
jgi:hypothetical protein